MGRQKKPQPKTLTPVAGSSSDSQPSVLNPSSRGKLEVDAELTQKTISLGQDGDLLAQLALLQQQLSGIQKTLSSTSSPLPQQHKTTEEKQEKNEEEKRDEDVERRGLWEEAKEAALTSLAFVQDCVLDAFPYGYDTVDAYGPLVFWLLLIPLTIIGAGFVFKAGEFGSFIMEVNTVKEPCNSTNIISKMEEYGIRKHLCGAEAVAAGVDPHVTWWDFPQAEFCLFGGKQVVDLSMLSFPTDAEGPTIDFLFEQTEDGMLGIRRTPREKFGVVETDSFFSFLWQTAVDGKPVRLISCGPGYRFWDTNHVLYGMVLVVLSVLLMSGAKWAETTIYPMLGISQAVSAEGARRGVGNRAAWLLFYIVAFGYVGKALVIRDYWANDCSPFVEHRSYALGLRWFVSYMNPTSYFTFTGATLEEELGLDKVQLGTCDWAHLLAYSRFNPGEANFYHLFSPSHLYYALIGYSKYIVFKFFLLKLWFIVLRPLSAKVSARWKRVQERRAGNRKKIA